MHSFLSRKQPSSASLYLPFRKEYGQPWACTVWALVVSTVDNIIKPYVLQGQSKLHPLLALLSILGGVGPRSHRVFIVLYCRVLESGLNYVATELDTLSDETRGEGNNALEGNKFYFVVVRTG